MILLNEWHEIGPLVLKAPQTMIFCLFFGILLNSPWAFFDQRRIVFRTAGSSSHQRRPFCFKSSSSYCNAHCTRLSFCVWVNIGVARGKMFLYACCARWRCTVHRETYWPLSSRNFLTVSPIIISLFLQIQWPIALLSDGVILQGQPLPPRCSTLPRSRILAIFYRTVRTGIFVRRAMSAAQR